MRVVFRLEVDGTVVALFPDIVTDREQGLIQAMTEDGIFNEEYAWVMLRTRRTHGEHEPLLRLIESHGYRVHVIRRRGRPPTRTRWRRRRVQLEGSI